MRLSLSARFILLIAILMAVIFAAITSLVVTVNTTRLRDELANEVTAFASLATKPIGDTFVLYADSGTVRIGQEIEKFTDLDSNVSNVQVIDVRGNVVFDQNKVTGIAVGESIAASSSPTYNKDGSGNLVRIVYPYIEGFGLHRYAVVYYVTPESVNYTVGQTASIIIMAGIIGLILASGIIYFSVDRFFIKPIKHISLTATLIRAGSYGQQIRLTRNDELGDLATSLNDMASRLEDDIHKLQEVDRLKSEFMTIASHNLRTPLTVINGSLDIMRGQKPTGIIQKMMESIAANSYRLGAFAEDMLAIASLEAGENVFDLSEVSASEIFTTVPRFEALAKEKGVHFSADVMVDDRTLKASVTHLRTAIWNLLDNAIKFTSKGGSITLTAHTANDNLTITITDTGAGIDPAEIPKLFTKFHRGTDLMSYNYEGTGVGLYLTKLIIDHHKGSTNVASQLGQGTTVTIKLPLTTAG